MGVEKARIHQPRTLNEEECLASFSKIAFSSNEEAKQHSDLEEVGKEIMQKCRRLPLAGRFATENPCEIYQQNFTPLIKASLASFTYLGNLAPGGGHSEE
ncbi:hypothetical protein OIU85_002585 [Salix viminalis]|uniref:NB-ARC domain-containing protein n=1 Tax=Salix viminalis TaxID=40686 RepID=A0A9Q0VNR3_SALVM|nr:hypothetical protein OIU85_002585 [Salix viminalis]